MALLETFESLRAESKSNNIWAPQFSLSGHLLWNSLQEEIKTAPNLNTFKNLIKNGVVQYANAIFAPIVTKRCKANTYKG